MPQVPTNAMRERIEFDIPHPFTDDFLFTPASYKVAYGGRGSAKSTSFARALIATAVSEKHLILCTREFQNSISDSVHRLLGNSINAMGLSKYFDIQKATIICPVTGSEFIFKGLRRNAEEIKSTEGVTRCWVAEARSTSEDSWTFLDPTIRTEGAEVWVDLNPDQEDDPTYKRFIINPPPGSIVRKVSWRDNPYFPKRLDELRRHMLRTDPEAYDWVWEGHCRKITEATIFRDKYTIEAFDIPEDVDRFFYGADWGFAVDPSVLVRFYIRNNCLYICDEAFAIGKEGRDLYVLFAGGTDRAGDEWPGVPGATDWPIKADSARPETISQMRRMGLNISAADKWKGCVEDGIAHLKSFDHIFIHERCVNMAQEARLYSYKVDARNKQVLPIVLDKHNHGWDACVAEGQLVSTSRGSVPIESVRVGDYVHTRRGLRRVNAVRCNGVKSVWKVQTAQHTLIATPDHEVYTTGRGFACLDTLRYGDEVLINQETSQWNGAGLHAQNTQKLPFFLGNCIDGIQTVLGWLIVHTSSLAEPVVSMPICTGLSGNIIAGQFHQVTTFITNQELGTTLSTPTISNVLVDLTTYRGTKKNGWLLAVTVSGLLHTWKISDHSVRHGTVVRKGWLRIASLVRRLTSGLFLRLSNVCGAAAIFLPERRGIKISTVLTSARLRLAAHLVLMMKPGHVLSVEQLLDAPSTQTLHAAPDRVVCVEDTGTVAKVYDLSVAGSPEFFASGILVHNCRYGLDGYIQGRGRSGVWAKL
jgi:phage terminase large subunit